MKNPIRIGSIVIALGLIGLLGGCVNPPASSSSRVRQARDFEVVETSTRRTLTPREMEHLRVKVADYLEQQGEVGTGDYYVKIYLGAEAGLEEGEWVVVRYTRYPATRVEYVAAYPDYYDYRSTYAYDYYPFGYYGFGRLSFQYYDYPYFGHRHYPPFRRPHHGHGHGHHGNPRPPPDDNDNPGPRPDHRPSGALKPSFVPANVARTRGNNEAPSAVERSRDYTFPRRLDSRQRGRSQQTASGLPAPTAMNVIPGVSNNPSTAPSRVPPATGASVRTPRTASPGPGAPDSARQRYDRARTPEGIRQRDDRSHAVTPTEGTRQRPERPNGVATPPRDSGTRERRYVPPESENGRPTREARTESTPRHNPSSGFKPSAPRAEPAPVQSPREYRSESRPEPRSEPRSESRSDSSSSHSTPPARTESDSPTSSRRNDNNDGGHRFHGR